MRPIKILLFFCAAIIPFSVSAQGWQRIESKYLFHLYFDEGEIAVDPNYRFPYDIIPEPASGSANPYRAEVVNFLNKVGMSVNFDPQQGNPNFRSGSFSVEIPYVADGREVNFYNGQNRKLLTVPVSDTSFCDDDTACETEFGEDYLNCPYDCKEAILPGPGQASPSVPDQSGENGQSGRNYLIWIIIGAGILAGTAVYLFRWLKSRSNRSADKKPDNLFNQ
jgi:hypothetical protein